MSYKIFFILFRFSTIIGTAGLFTISLSSGRWIKQIINGVERIIQVAGARTSAYGGYQAWNNNPGNSGQANNGSNYSGGNTGSGYTRNNAGSGGSNSGANNTGGGTSK